MPLLDYKRFNQTTQSAYMPVGLVILFLVYKGHVAGTVLAKGPMCLLGNHDISDISTSNTVKVD